MNVPSTPPRALACPKSPVGRILTYNAPLPEIMSSVKQGSIVVGDSIGVCGPACGQITVKMSSQSAKNANRMYASCAANSSEGHKSFVWLDQEMQERPVSKRLQVPHALHVAGDGTLILTVTKRTKFSQVNDMVVRLRQLPLEQGTGTFEVSEDSLGLFHEVCQKNLIGSYVCLSIYS